MATGIATGSLSRGFPIRVEDHQLLEEALQCQRSEGLGSRLVYLVVPNAKQQ